MKGNLASMEYWTLESRCASTDNDYSFSPIGLPQVLLLGSGQADLNEDVKPEIMGKNKQWG